MFYTLLQVRLLHCQAHKYFEFSIIFMIRAEFRVKLLVNIKLT